MLCDGGAGPLLCPCVPVCPGGVSHHGGAAYLPEDVVREGVAHCPICHHLLG